MHTSQGFWSSSFLDGALHVCRAHALWKQSAVVTRPAPVLQGMWDAGNGARERGMSFLSISHVCYNCGLTVHHSCAMTEVTAGLCGRGGTEVLNGGGKKKSLPMHHPCWGAVGLSLGMGSLRSTGLFLCCQPLPAAGKAVWL